MSLLGPESMRAVICDDHAIFSQGMCAVVLSVFPGAVLEVVTSLGALQHRLDQSPPLDLLLLDYSLGDGDVEALLPKLAPLPTKVLVVSASEEPALILRMLASGAAGFVPKSAPLERMQEALKLVNSGGVHVPELTIEAETTQNRPTNTSHFLKAPQSDNWTPHLTERQCELANLLASGFTNREIRDELQISENTVKTHLRAIFKALDVTNRTEAAVEWIRTRG